MFNLVFWILSNIARSLSKLPILSFCASLIVDLILNLITIYLGILCLIKLLFLRYYTHFIIPIIINICVCPPFLPYASPSLLLKHLPFLHQLSLSYHELLHHRPSVTNNTFQDLIPKNWQKIPIKHQIYSDAKMIQKHLQKYRRR